MNVVSLKGLTDCIVMCDKSTHLLTFMMPCQGVIQCNRQSNLGLKYSSSIITVDAQVQQSLSQTAIRESQLNGSPVWWVGGWGSSAGPCQ